MVTGQPQIHELPVCFKLTVILELAAKRGAAPAMKQTGV